MQTTQPPLGHVALVINVNLIEQTWTISEMNVYGLDIVDQKTMPLSQAQNFNFIHNPKVIYHS
jgi:surface antigen